MNFIKGFTSLQPCTFDYTLLALSYYMYRVYHYSFELYTNNLLFILTKVESYTNQITSRITYSILGLSMGRTRLSKEVPYPPRLPAGPEGEFLYPDPLYPRVQTRLPGPVVPAGPDSFTKAHCTRGSRPVYRDS